MQCTAPPLTLDADGKKKLWGPDWHCHLFANQLAAAWGLKTDYDHYGVIEAPLADQLFAVYSAVETLLQDALANAKGTSNKTNL